MLTNADAADADNISIKQGNDMTRTKARGAPVAEPAGNTPQQKGIMALQPCVNGAAVMSAFQKPLMGEDADMGVMIAGLRGTFEKVKEGDLEVMERMLVSQAMALQTMFASFARRASIQDSLRHIEAYAGLALKAQSQSRATIAALVDLKYPRHATFVKQTNVAHGPQQVNNGTAPPPPPHAAAPRGKENEPEQNKLLEADHGQPGSRLDTGAQAAPTRSDQTVEAVAEVHGAEQR